jgi:hypothetical protein
MTIIFEVTDRNGKRVHLSDERWQHINYEHPEVGARLEEIVETLKQPMHITRRKGNVTCYYRHQKGRQGHLLVIVKYLNSHGFIITAYYTKLPK